MKKITFAFFLLSLAATLSNCYKGKQERYLPDQIIGLWSETAFHYKAYKGAAIIEEYTEAISEDKEITILFYKNGTFETYERNREAGKWVITEHVKGTCRYLPDTGTLIMEDTENKKRSEATVLILTGRQLTLSQSVSPASNSKADRETVITDFKRASGNK